MSAFDAAVLRQLTDHLGSEAEILDEYRLLAASPDPAVRYVAQLILEDEERHHRVLSELANKFRASVEFVDPADRVPWITPSGERAALGRSLRRLRNFERRDLRQLRKLARRLRPLRRYSLDGVLVTTLQMDTRKHLRYLRELQRLTRAR